MADAAIRRMSADEFLAWGLSQDWRYELVGGVPVAMAGAKRRHDQIVVNALIALGNRLAGGSCRPFTADTAVRIPAGNVRRPDVGVDCGGFHDEAAAADAPRLVIEVLSPSTRAFDMFGKLDEYKTVSELMHIVLIDPDAPQAIHWQRGQDGAWSHQVLEGLVAEIRLPDLALTLSLGEAYAGLTFQPRPRLVPEPE